MASPEVIDAITVGYLALTAAAVGATCIIAGSSGHSAAGVVMSMVLAALLWPFAALYFLAKGALAAPQFLRRGFVELHNEYMPAKPKLPKAKVVK